MTYKIKVSYQTGDSFSSEDVEKYLDVSWESKEAATKSLQRINNHYEYYRKNHLTYKKPKGKLPEGVKWNEEFRMLSLVLITSDGKDYLYHPDWCGYFETLHWAEIVSDEDRYTPI